MSAWQWQENSQKDCCIHTLHPQSKNQGGERKANKQKAFLVLIHSREHKAMETRNSRSTLLVTRVCLGNTKQTIKIFLYPFTYLFWGNNGKTKEVRLRKSLSSGRQVQWPCFSEKVDLTGLRCFRCNCLETSGICFDFCTDVTHHFLLPHACEKPDHLM